ncbi:hypothetical protein U1Q18_001371 [Sarracenia purpurea var. burkii]
MELVIPYPSLIYCGVNFSQKNSPSLRIKGAYPMPQFTLRSKTTEFQVIQRRSAHYHPNIWDPKFIESLCTYYTYESHGTVLDNMKQEVRRLLKATREHSDMLKLIDSMQRLGVAYHFQEEIEAALNLVQFNTSFDLHTTALQFRLLRENGYPISSDVFNKFKDIEGGFMKSLSQDVTGLLSLYEASYYGMDSENDLEEAKNFSVKHLSSLIGKMNIKVAEQVRRSLEIPLRWRMPRLEARNFIDLYPKDNGVGSSLLLELSKLDYNLVQSVHQKEVKELMQWWMDLGLKEELSFSRDRLVENYLWALGVISEPTFSNFRIGLTKFVCLFSAIDDVYDIYGSIEELERFTDAVTRWDIKAINDLPEYMKICYLAMFNFGNEIAYNVLKDHGLNVISYIKEEWANLCRSYLVEARWFNCGYTPTLDEYLENAWFSVGGHGATAHGYLLLGSPITKTSLDNIFTIGSKAEPIYWSSLITRLSDDLGTYKVEIMRGDVAKSIQCYMTKEGVTEEQARDHIEDLKSLSWRKLNEAKVARCDWEYTSS